MPGHQQQQSQSQSQAVSQEDSSQEHEVAPSNSEVQAQLTGPDDGGDAGGGDGGGEEEVEAPEPETVKKGPKTYKRPQGTKLSTLSKWVYGHEHYWEKIRDENLGSTIYDVGGNLMFHAWTEIKAPEIEIPKDGPAEGEQVPPGGDAESFMYEREVTPHGNFTIWPDAWPGDRVSFDPGDIIVKRSDLAAKKQELIDKGADDRRTISTAINGAAEERIEELTKDECKSLLETTCALPVTEINAARRAMANDRWARLLELAAEDLEVSEAHARYVAGTKKKFDGTDPSKDEIDAFFALIDDADTYALQELMGMRFDFDVGGRDGGAWTSAGLRRAYEVLEQLPPGHVQDNQSLDLLLRSNSDSGSGYYRHSDDSAVFGYRGWALGEEGSYGKVMVDGTDEGLHSEVNLFNTVLRHEIGHAVDAKLGVSSGYAQNTETAGKWKTYGSASAFVDDVIATHPNGMGDYDHPAEYEKALRKAVDEGTSFDKALTSLRDAGEFGDTEVADYAGGQSGPVDILRTPNLWKSDKNPWYREPSRAGVGGRRFHQAYSSTYVSYKADVYESNAVSAYQFRAPGEWFAEAYACFYSDHDSVTGNPPGTRLATRDTATRDYIKANVDNNHSFPDEVPEAAEGGETADTNMASSGPTG